MIRWVVVLVIISAIAYAGWPKVSAIWAEHVSTSEAERANLHQNPTPQPTCATYIVSLPGGDNKELTVCYSGHGQARLIWAGQKRDVKEIMDYQRGWYGLYKPGVTNEVDRRGLGGVWPMQHNLPPFYDAATATALGAKCVGSGWLKGHEYHRWVLPGIRSTQPGMSESIEVWTDADGAFPCYFRHVEQGGATTEWKMTNAWVDESLAQSEPDFFYILEPLDDDGCAHSDPKLDRHYF